MIESNTLAATSTMARIKADGLRGASPESTETSLWTWLYDLLHPCHPHDQHHDCHSSGGGSSSSSSTDDDSYYYDDVNVDSTGEQENISNDLDDEAANPSGGTFTISDVFSGQAKTSSYVMFMILGLALVGSIVAAVMMRWKRQHQLNEEALAEGNVNLVKNRHSSFRFFASRSKSFNSVEPGFEMGETKSNVDFVRVEGR